MSLDKNAHQLSEAAHQEVFEQIKKVEFLGAEPQKTPIAIIFGGQPGAGKSAALTQAKKELVGRGGCIEIIGDDLRSYHPKYAELLEKDDKTAAFYTDGDSGRWVEKSIAYAKEKKVNIVIEGTMRDADKVAETMSSLRQADYTIEARGIAVNFKLSELGILLRYEQQKEERGFGRMTTDAAHTAAYKGLPVTLGRIESDKLADKVTLLVRSGETIYTNELVSGQWVNAPSASEVLEGERNREFTVKEQEDYLSGLTTVVEKMDARDATPKEMQPALDVHNNETDKLKAMYKEFRETIQKPQAHEAAAKNFNDNLKILIADSRYDKHEPQEILAAAYFRGYSHESSALGGTPSTYEQIDGAMTDVQTAIAVIPLMLENPNIEEILKGGLPLCLERQPHPDRADDYPEDYSL